MGFKNFISNGLNRVKSDIQQGLIGAKNILNTTKKGLIGAKNFITNNREIISGALKAVSPFVTAINPVIGAGLNIGGNLLDSIPKGNVQDKFETISDQINQGQFMKNSYLSGSVAAQEAVNARKVKSKRVKASPLTVM